MQYSHRTPIITHWKRFGTLCGTVSSLSLSVVRFRYNSSQFSWIFHVRIMQSILYATRCEHTSHSLTFTLPSFVFSQPVFPFAQTKWWLIFLSLIPCQMKTFGCVCFSLYYGSTASHNYSRTSVIWPLLTSSLHYPNLSNISPIFREVVSS